MLPSLLSCSLTGLALLSPDDGSTFALRVTRVHVGDGTVIENGVVTIADGRIQEVGKGVAVPKDVPLIELEGDLTPGLIALVDHSGAGGEGRDSTRTVSETLPTAPAV